MLRNCVFYDSKEDLLEMFQQKLMAIGINDVSSCICVTSLKTDSVERHCRYIRVSLFRYPYICNYVVRLIVMTLACNTTWNLTQIEGEMMQLWRGRNAKPSHKWRELLSFIVKHFDVSSFRLKYVCGRAVRHKTSKKKNDSTANSA